MLILTTMFIGKNLRHLRTQAGLTQADLAKALKVRQQVIASYEKCLANPEVAKLPAMAAALKVEVAELFQEGERKEGPAVKVRRANSREVRAQEAFRNLKPEEQRVIISHMNALLRATKQKHAAAG
ncbi:MAG: helix-turn-helix domain-containing protein [Fibrobacterota bacterium]|nr:helix-turn-helix domain-containing protein [Fibrobacterota bacterium]